MKAILLQSMKNKEYSSSILLISVTEQEYYRMPIIFWFWNREKLLERGTFKELLEKKGYLYKTWSIQNDS